MISTNKRKEVFSRIAKNKLNSNSNGKIVDFGPKRAFRISILCAIQIILVVVVKVIHDISHIMFDF
jgi:hypothetical protein